MLDTPVDVQEYPRCRPTLRSSCLTISKAELQVRGKRRETLNSILLLLLDKFRDSPELRMVRIDHKLEEDAFSRGYLPSSLTNAFERYWDFLLVA